jgi:3-phosphoshikimate 1-carboxyvinyltransferase
MILEHIKAAPSVRLHHPSRHLRATVQLPASKSESNRALIIAALCQQPCQLTNLAEARDTATMQRLLLSPDHTLDVLDAGTTMRFLTAWCAATHREAVLTGSARMKERPILVLVDALRELGAEIDYLENEGCPPIHIKKFSLAKNRVAIRGDVSSQYISALLMVAPVLPGGLTLELTGRVASRPYIEMTLQLMENFGVGHTWRDNFIHIPEQAYTASSYAVESDWSAASYWFSMVALADEAEVKLLGLKAASLQGDREIVRIMAHLGVQTQFEADGIVLTKIPAQATLEWDFSHCPDLAQTIAVVGAAKGIGLKMNGLESLRIKETDRTAALQAELARFGVATEAFGDTALHMTPGQLRPSDEWVRTYKDHRMAMAFAPLGLRFGVEIERPEVVDKSYPRFWDDLAQVGFVVQ